VKLGEPSLVDCGLRVSHGTGIDVRIAGPIMHEQIENRLDALRREMAFGEERMQDLEQQVAKLRETMLRISGAIQVLEELQSEAATAATNPQDGNGAHDPPAQEAEPATLLISPATSRDS
jgi:uncharacterized coiled-coil protein SlyX